MLKQMPLAKGAFAFLGFYIRSFGFISLIKT